MNQNYYKQLLGLAIPISLGQLGNIIANMSDSLMLGNYKTDHLAGASFGFNVFITVLLFGMGFAMGITPFVARSVGSKNAKELASILKNGFLTNILFGVFTLIILIGLYFIMPYMGQDEQILKLAQPYFELLIWSMVPLIFYNFLRQFIEGFGLTKPAMVFSFISNSLNIFLNYLWIEGHYGFKELGIIGAGYATVIARVLLPVLMITYIFSNKKLRLITLNTLKVKFNFELQKEIYRISFPISIQLCIEVFTFASAAIAIGTFGKDYLAAHQIAISLGSISYIIISGVGAGSTILIGQLLGQKRLDQIKKVTNNIIVVSFLFMTVTGLIFFLFREQLPLLYLAEKDPKIIEITASMLIVCAVFQWPDGLQAVLLGALRGLKDVTIPTIITIVAYWLFSIPFGQWLAHTCNFGPIGIWIGLLAGLTLSATFLYIRLRKIVDRFD